MKPCIAVALSGGIDSLTTAWLLKESGYQVIGVHFVTGYEGYNQSALDQKQPSIEGILKAARAKLGSDCHPFGYPVKNTRQHPTL